MTTVDTPTRRKESTGGGCWSGGEELADLSWTANNFHFGFMVLFGGVCGEAEKILRADPCF